MTKKKQEAITSIVAKAVTWKRRWTIRPIQYDFMILFDFIKFLLILMNFDFLT